MTTHKKKRLPPVERGFEEANRLAARGSFSAERRAQEADELRRQMAREGHEPSFPPEWSEPLAKFWITNDGTGEQRHPMRPDGILHLTVWRWDGFEATATFDRYMFCKTQRAERLGWRKVPPPIGAWEEAGPTDHLSTLWTRAIPTGGPRND